MAWKHFHFFLKTRVQVWIQVILGGKNPLLIFCTLSHTNKRAEAEALWLCFYKWCQMSKTTAAHRWSKRHVVFCTESMESSEWHPCGLMGLLWQWQQLHVLTAVCLNDKGKPCQLWRIVDFMTNDSLKAIYILDRVNPSSLTNPWQDGTL